MMLSLSTYRFTVHDAHKDPFRLFVVFRFHIIMFLYISFRLFIHSYNILNTIQPSICQPFHFVANKNFKDWDLVKFYDGIRIYEFKNPSLTEGCSSKGIINFMGRGIFHIDYHHYHPYIFFHPLYHHHHHYHHILSVIDVIDNEGWIKYLYDKAFLKHNTRRLSHPNQANSTSIRHRKAQLTIPCSSYITFLTIMESKHHFWPMHGRWKVNSYILMQPSS
jgi:hypothetical protein